MAIIMSPCMQARGVLAPRSSDCSRVVSTEPDAWHRFRWAGPEARGRGSGCSQCAWGLRSRPWVQAQKPALQGASFLLCVFSFPS